MTFLSKQLKFIILSPWYSIQSKLWILEATVVRTTCVEWNGMRVDVIVDAWSWSRLAFFVNFVGEPFACAHHVNFWRVTGLFKLWFFVLDRELSLEIANAWWFVKAFWFGLTEVGIFLQNGCELRIIMTNWWTWLALKVSDRLFKVRFIFVIREANLNIRRIL